MMIPLKIEKTDDSISKRSSLFSIQNPRTMPKLNLFRFASQQTQFQISPTRTSAKRHTINSKLPDDLEN